MFFARPEPLELAAEALLALRLSLNTPVVSTAELPVGPARAALAVHLEARGCPNVTVAIRSLGNDACVHYSFDGDLASESSVAVAVDAGLSFAETMGFLFGEDELCDDGDAARERALERWDQIARDGGPAGGPGGETPASSDAEREFLLDELANSLSEALGNEGPEIMLELEEEVTSELEIEREPPAPAAPEPDAPALASAPAPEGSADPAAPAPPSLSKFRGPPAPAPAPSAEAEEEAEDRNESTQHTLGRLKLVKRRRGRLAAGTEKPNPILRLLSSF